MRMSVSSSGVTPSRVDTVCPVQWMEAFAYTPDPPPVVHNGGHQQSGLTTETYLPPGDDADALPTHFHLTEAVGGAVQPGGDLAVLADGSEANSTEAPSPPSNSIPHDLSVTHGPSSRKRTRKTRSYTRDTSPSKGTNDKRHRRQHRSRSRRVVLDAVVIVNKKSLQGRMAKTVYAGRSTESALPTGTRYPSPLVSHVPGDVTVHVDHITVEREEHVSPEPTLPPKTSKYFPRPSVSPSRLSYFAPEKSPLLTPSSPPVLTIPVSVESSHFQLDGSLEGRPKSTVDESRRHVATHHDNTGLFDDLMVMLRRLKPILVQESVRNDPWKVLIAVRLLNVTTGKAAIPVFCKIISLWPTPRDLMHAPQDELVELLRPLGLYNKRARWLKEMSERFFQDQETPTCTRTSLASLLSEERTMASAADSRYPGVGKYALDSLRIFCAGDKDAWKHVMPRDKELVRYLRWRWAVEDGKMWYPDGTGVIGDVDVLYLVKLVDELAAHYDDTIGGEGYMYHFANDLCGFLRGDTTVSEDAGMGLVL